jgi:hypothetical protein
MAVILIDSPTKPSGELYIASLVNVIRLDTEQVFGTWRVGTDYVGSDEVLNSFDKLRGDDQPGFPSKLALDALFDLDWIILGPAKIEVTDAFQVQFDDEVLWWVSCNEQDFDVRSDLESLPHPA